MIDRMPDTPVHFFDLTPDTLRERVQSLGMPAFRAKQIMEWVYQKGAARFEVMTNLGKADRQKLAEHIRITDGNIIASQEASDGTRKLLIDWPNHQAEPQGTALPQLGQGTTSGGDGQTECVMIPAPGSVPKPDSPGKAGRLRRTACISSQVGCPVGCTFCASGLGGLETNLTPGRIVEQAWRLHHLVPEQPLTNVVFMGMGEPLSNFVAVTQAVRALTADWGLGLSARRVTVSTVGLPAQIRRLADIDLPITLAISLHAPNDELRKQLIPWAEYVTIDELAAAARHYFNTTGREVTLEYILLGGVNDQPEHATELARFARTIRCNVNLIRYNEVKGMPYHRPTTDDVRQFQDLLRAKNVNTHIRASRGRDIAAACGQLRHETKQAAGNAQR